MSALEQTKAAQTCAHEYVSIRARGLGRAIRHLRNLWFHKWVCAVSREPLRFGK